VERSGMVTPLSAIYHREAPGNPTSALILTAIIHHQDAARAFELTQHGALAPDWSDHERVMLTRDGPVRSSLPGDILSAQGGAHQFQAGGTHTPLDAVPTRPLIGSAVWNTTTQDFELSVLDHTRLQDARDALSAETRLSDFLQDAQPGSSVKLALREARETAGLQRKAALIPLPLTSEPMSVAALKRELRPGRKLALLQRSADPRLRLWPVPLREVMHVGSTEAMLSAPEQEARRSYLTFPTDKNGWSLSRTAQGFMLSAPSQLRLVYAWLN